MPRQISQQALTAMLAQDTAKVFVVTLKITGAGIEEPILLVNDNVPLVAGAETYQPFPFDVILPTDDADKPPVARLRISNVTQLIVDELRTLPEPPNVELCVRLADNPTVIDYGPWSLDATAATYNIDQIEVDLRMRDFTIEPFPYLRFTANYFPGLFRK